MNPWVWLTAYLVSFAAFQLFLYHYFSHRDSTLTEDFDGPRGQLQEVNSRTLSRATKFGVAPVGPPTKPNHCTPTVESVLTG